MVVVGDSVLVVMLVVVDVFDDGVIGVWCVVFEDVVFGLVVYIGLYVDVVGVDEVLVVGGVYCVG